jgi:hypothetical protein
MFFLGVLPVYTHVFISFDVLMHTHIHRSHRSSGVTHTKSERSALEVCDSPFMISLKFAFQTSQKLYLVTECVVGGDLLFHLQVTRTPKKKKKDEKMEKKKI